MLLQEVEGQPYQPADHVGRAIGPRRRRRDSATS
jgi:hypothetical protein